MIDKQKAKLDYKLSHRPMGVFQIRNAINGKIFVDSSINVPGKINRHRFSLEMGGHKSKVLQQEWAEFGEAAFVFETLEPLEPREDPAYDHAADLEVLEDLWLEKLEPYGDNGYNERKKSREERLRMIAANRNL
ncbi:MAG TPA: GIY-YIG nuclease family protein [Pyrinomonadaceae bacterium]|jgi:hypothetical protein|nr:GIY-YIG nuclease family protein [Pyrinomonadaceae bacterium]